MSFDGDDEWANAVERLAFERTVRGLLEALVSRYGGGREYPQVCRAVDRELHALLLVRRLEDRMANAIEAAE